MNIYLEYNEQVCNFDDEYSCNVGINVVDIESTISTNEEIEEAILKIEYMSLALKKVLRDRRNNKSAN